MCEQSVPPHSSVLAFVIKYVTDDNRNQLENVRRKNDDCTDKLNVHDA